MGLVQEFPRRYAVCETVFERWVSATRIVWSSGFLQRRKLAQLFHRVDVSISLLVSRAGHSRNWQASRAFEYAQGFGSKPSTPRSPNTPSVHRPIAALKLKELLFL